MKDLLLRAGVVVRASNIKFHVVAVADYVKKLHQKSVLHEQHDYFSSFNQSNH